MNIYTAIMMAADHIDEQVSRWHYSAAFTPTTCDSPACALGWIGYCAGYEGGIDVGNIAETLLNIPETEFYSRMAQINSPFYPSCWIAQAGVAAKCLRLYAEQYHSHEKPVTHTGIPESVRKIFLPQAKVQA